MVDWHRLKIWMEKGSGLDMDALHVHAGVLGLILVALLLRRPLSSLWPWLVMFAAALANEAYDLHYDVWPPDDRGRQIGEGVRDLWNTMLLPTVILLVARYWPKLITGRGPKPDDSAADPG
jgi:hypothetical protein